MKNLTIRRMTERGEQLLKASADEMVANTPRRDPAHTIYEWRRRGGKLPHFRRYVRYLQYRRNLRWLGIG